MKRTLLSLAAAMALLAGAAAHAQPQIVPVLDAPRAPGAPYAATGLPDRIVLTPGADPARAMAVAFRTDARQTLAQAEIGLAAAGPSVAKDVRALSGETRTIETENGQAAYHQIRFDDLSPATRYVYRVRGADGWSEWIGFRTAAADAQPFTFLYFGDLQNGILHEGSRTVRTAYAMAANPAFALHAGDLVASRDDLSHDDEWGEWTAAAGALLGAIPQAPAPGNHEYVDALNPDGSETRLLAPHWPLQFALPANGAEAAAATSYFFDYQGARFIALDGTAAIDLGALDSQTAWLRQVLADAGDRWTIVVMHQPIFTCARPRDTELLNAVWRPVFEEYGVDLVLQGHDHCYARYADPPAAGDTRQRAANRTLHGPVYIVSVAGRKMYGLNDRVRYQADRWAEDTQMFQILDVSASRISYRAHLATGELYDAFELERGQRGLNRLRDGARTLGPARECATSGAGPDGAPCTAEPKD